MYLSTELNQFPPTRVCAFYVFFGRLPWRIISAGRRPCSARFPSIHHLAAVCTGRQEGGATSMLNQPNSMIHRSVERLKLYQKSPLGSKSLHTERQGGRVCATSTLNQQNFSISLHLTQLFMCILPEMHLKLLLEGMRETITRKGNCKGAELGAV